MDFILHIATYLINHIFEGSRVYERLYHHQQLVVNQVVHYLNGVKVGMLYSMCIPCQQAHVHQLDCKCVVYLNVP